MPGVSPAAVASECSRLASGDRLDQAEVEHLDEVVAQPEPPDVDVRRLDVAVHQAARVRLLQRLAHLAQDVDHAARGHRAVPPHQRLEVHPVEQLHHEVERLVVGDAEVVELDGVRRPQVRRGFGLAPEPHDRPAAQRRRRRAPIISGRISLIAAGRASMRCVAL